MSDAKLWIDDADSTATIAGVNVSYTMPLWVFDVMRDIIVTEAEKKVEVTHRDFDIQQELLDRYRADNAELRELIQDMWTLLVLTGNDDVLVEIDVNGSRKLFSADEISDRMRGLGMEADV